MVDQPSSDPILGAVHNARTVSALPAREPDPAAPPEESREPERDGQEILAECAELDQNDTDNARRLILHFGRDAMNVREVGVHGWIGTHWDPEGGAQALERCAQVTAKRIKLEVPHIAPKEGESAAIKAAEALEEIPPDQLDAPSKEIMAAGAAAKAALAARRGGRYKFAVSSGNRNRTVAMIAQALPHITVAPADLDSDPMLFNVRNGTLEFRKWHVQVEDLDCPDPDITRYRREVRVAVRLKAHDRADRIAKLAPVSYEPRARCPRFLKFIVWAQPEKANRRFLQTAIGRGLLGGAQTQALIFLYGDGANGKSVVIETFAELLGGYAGRLKPEAISGQHEQASDKANPDMARLAGKRLVVIEELPRNAPLRESLVKTMTGGTPMPVRHLNKGLFDLNPEFIPIMTGNDMPEIGGLDAGIWRRMKFLRFAATIAAAEQRPLKEVVAEFMEEGPGILRWLVEGALRFLRDGLVDPAGVTALTQSHREDLDPVGAFLAACVSTSAGGRVQARSMYEAFVAFCEANAIRPWKETMFGRALKRKGLKREDKRIREWLDVVLHDVPERAPRSPVKDARVADD